MTRILLLIVIAALVYLAFKSFFKSATKKNPPPTASTPNGEDMVTCARCGVNMPRSSAKEEGGKLVCRDNPKCTEVRT